MSSNPFVYSTGELFAQQNTAYCNLAAGVILFFDHLITFGDEIEHIWKRRFSGATVLFLLNRYSTFIKTILGFVTLWTTSFGVCKYTEPWYNVFDLIALFVFAAFSSFRVWAIWGRELRPFLIVLPFTLVTPCLNAYRISVASTYYADQLPPPWGGCGVNFGMPVHLYIIDVVRGIAIATDALVLVMTWMKTRSIYKAARRAKVGTGISELLLRDGTTYFGFLLVFNIVDMILNHTDSNFNPVNYFNDVINCILISRFMLNLRSVSSNPWDRAAGTTTLTQGQLEFIQTNLLGDLGGPLTYDSSSDYTDSTDGEVSSFERANGPLATGLHPRRSDDALDTPDGAWLPDEFCAVDSLHAADERPIPLQCRRSLDARRPYPLADSCPPTPVDDDVALMLGEPAEAGPSRRRDSDAGSP